MALLFVGFAFRVIEDDLKHEDISNTKETEENVTIQLKYIHLK